MVNSWYDMVDFDILKNRAIWSIFYCWKHFLHILKIHSTDEIFNGLNFWVCEKRGEASKKAHSIGKRCQKYEYLKQFAFCLKFSHGVTKGKKGLFLLTRHTGVDVIFTYHSSSAVSSDKFSVNFERKKDMFFNLVKN